MLVERVRQLLLFEEIDPFKQTPKPQDLRQTLVGEPAPPNDQPEPPSYVGTGKTKDEIKGLQKHPPRADLVGDYELVRSRRRTLSLSIKNGRLHVRAPLRAPKYWIENTILEKKPWIDTQILEQRTKQQEQLQISHQSKLTLNGQRYTICFCQQDDNHSSIANEIPCDDPIQLHARNRRGKALLDEKKIHFKFAVNITGAQREFIAASLFADWLKKEAPALLEARVWQLSKDLGFTELHQGLRFRMTKSAWGYCTADGIIQLNPSIILAPPFVRDYVIIHELCHLRHANHSKRFWQLVAQKCVHWREADRWLDDEGHRVTIAMPTH